METRNRDAYFAVALDLLADEGAKAVTIANLCERLDVTKGSFYHHFESGPVFLAELLAHWEHEFGHRLAREAMGITEVDRRLGALVDMAVDLHHEAESAIRALARTDPLAAEVQGRVDSERTSVIVRTLVEVGLPTDHARDLASIGVSILVGMQQRQPTVDRDELRRLFGHYQSWLVDEVPGTAEA